MTEPTERSSLADLAMLVREKNALDARITAITGRPALIGHLGEYIASAIFGIRLHESATHKGSDGYFTSGDVVGRSVNIKWYAKNESVLDLHQDAPPDFYLVLSGPRPGAITRGGVRPWLIENVYLFDAGAVHAELSERGTKIGIAASVRKRQWAAAEIYPTQQNASLILNDEQRDLLALFKSDTPIDGPSRP